MLPDVARIAALIGDPVRAQILFALLDGTELSASELARRGGASAQSASGHLGKLADAGLIHMRAAGRQRLFRIASLEVAEAMEALAAIAQIRPINSLSQHNAMQRLRRARTCYDHLAGQLGVAVTEALCRDRVLEKRSGEFRVSSRGERVFTTLGIDVAAVAQSRRHFARPCMDWTERRHHLAGALGAALLERCLADGWVRRNTRDRSLEITSRGLTELRSRFRVTVEWQCNA